MGNNDKIEIYQYNNIIMDDSKIIISNDWDNIELEKKIIEYIKEDKKYTIEFDEVDFNDELFNVVTPLFKNNNVGSIEFVGFNFTNQLSEHNKLSDLINQCDRGIEIYFEYDDYIDIIYGCTKVTEIYIRKGLWWKISELIKYTFNVKKLTIYDHSYVTDADIEHVIKSLQCRTITEFEFDMCQYYSVHDHSYGKIMDQLDKVLCDNIHTKEESINEIYEREKYHPRVSIPIKSSDTANINISNTYNPCSEIILEHVSTCNLHTL